MWQLILVWLFSKLSKAVEIFAANYKKSRLDNPALNAHMRDLIRQANTHKEWKWKDRLEWVATGVLDYAEDLGIDLINSALVTAISVAHQEYEATEEKKEAK